MAKPNQHSLTRRDFVLSLLTTGFALSVRPVSAHTISTDSNELVTEEIKINVTDGDIPAYLAYPINGNQFPVILVVHEIFGVHEHIKDVCRRFAKLGYLAVAPELFARQGDVSKISDMNEIISKVVSKVPDAQVMADLDATVNWISNHTKGDTSHIAITGFCWGGRITWLYCAHNPLVKAGIAWYGKLIGTNSELQPKYPVDIATQLKVPVLGLYGGKDKSISLENVANMNTLLSTGTSHSDIKIYPDASHAFFADYRPSYDEKSAIDGWKRLQDWLSNHDMKIN
jgi:carboxymethylenebutenolidase